MVRPIKNEPPKSTEQKQKASGTKKTSNSLQEGRKTVTQFANGPGKTLFGAGKLPAISKLAPKKVSERVASIAGTSPSLNLKKRSK